MEQLMTFGEFVERDLAALRSDQVQIGDSYNHPVLGEKKRTRTKG
jgi:hypothetical protein